MNRRTFLLGLGAVACSGTPKGEPPHPRRGSGGSPDAHGVEPTEDVVIANVQRSPIAIYREWLVQETRKGELVFWDTSVMTQLGTLALRTHGFCLLSYGAVAALVQPRGEKRIEVHLIDSKREVRVLRGPELDTEIDAEVVVGASPTELYISDAGYDVVRLELRDTEVRATARLKVQLERRRTLRQLASLGDGRVVVRGETKLSILEPKKAIVDVAIGGTIPVHVAAASSKRVWYSHAPKLAPPREVSLVRVDGKVDAHFESSADVWHMAAGAGALALLVHGEHVWSVVVIEETGSERWRADVPAQDLLAIAIAEHHVVVVDNSGMLRAWDTATGKPVS